MRYISTRGDARELSFEDAVLAGLASDGGLYVPKEVPTLSMAEITEMGNLSYSELAYNIISRFTGNEIDSDDLKNIINESYKSFRHKAVAPLKQLDSNTYLLELFHGETLAFKDFALQFLGRLLDYILKKRGQKIVIVGATSGDTGSAAIAGCRGRDNMDIFIMHPHNRVSEVQRRQMTSVMDSNVHNIALKGTFDDCQDIVKALFADESFRNRYNITAVNSINWARILAQVVYYFYSATRLGTPAKEVSFCVPTGNFGDIYAGYIAKKMGLPIERLIIATNRNDILSRTLKSGEYKIEGVEPSLSPSMDIQISSNFERLLFDLYNHNGSEIKTMMENFRSVKKLTLSDSALLRLRKEFMAESADDSETIATIKECFEDTGELLDPHSAVGLCVAKKIKNSLTSPVIVLATAHPAKFPEAVSKACAINPVLPPYLSDLLEREEKFIVIDNNVSEIKNFIEKNI
ncbi:MAG: threonine synthase [Rickettsiales bacterium]